MRSIKADLAASDPRLALLARLGEPTIRALLQSTSDPQPLDELLGALLDVPLDEPTRQLIADAQPNLLTGDLNGAASVLSTVGTIDLDLARTWVLRVGQQALLDRVANEFPWATRPEIRTEPEGVAACADIRQVSSSEQKDVHAEVVALCDMLGALVPDAALVVSNAILADGQPAGYRDYQIATKRIPRANLHSQALVSWNKRWSAALDARIAPSSYTNYLARAIELLEELVLVLPEALDRLLRAQNAPAHTAKLQAILLEAREMSGLRPAGVNEEEEAGTRSLLQSLIFSGAADLLRRFMDLPAQANAYLLWLGSFLKDIDKAIDREPWDLLGLNAPIALKKLRVIAADLRSMAGESSLVRINPAIAYRQRTAKAGKAWPTATSQSRRQLQARIDRVRDGMQATIEKAASRSQVYVKETLEAATWPPVDILVLPYVESLAQWLEQATGLWGTARAAAPASARLLVVPAVKGRAVPPFGVTGYDSLYPDPGGFEAWRSHVTREPWLTPKAEAFGDLFSVLTEISSMRASGYGAEGRPATERRALLRAEAVQSDAQRRLLEKPISAEARPLIDALVAHAQSSPGQFAASATAVIREQSNDLLLLMLTINIALTEQDIAEQLTSQMNDRFCNR